MDHFGSESDDEGLEPESGLAAVRYEESRLGLSPRGSFHLSVLKQHLNEGTVRAVIERLVEKYFAMHNLKNELGDFAAVAE